MKKIVDGGGGGDNDELVVNEVVGMKVIHL